MVLLENLQWNFSRDNLWRLIENLYPSLEDRWLLSAFVRVDLAVFKLRLRKRGKMIGGGDRKCRVWAIDHFRFDASSYVARYRQSMIARSCYKIDRTAQFSHYRESEDNRATLRSISLWILRNSAETIDPIAFSSRFHFHHPILDIASTNKCYLIRHDHRIKISIDIRVVDIKG